MPTDETLFASTRRKCVQCFSHATLYVTSTLDIPTMRAAIVLALSCVSCGASDDEPIVAANTIVNGTVETDAPWAVMVVQQTAGSTRVRLCTGTVIGSRAVLTAKHCVYRDPGSTTWEAVPISELTVRMGLNFRTSTRTVSVVSVRTTDGAYRDGDGRNGDDVAVLVTSDDLGIAPKPLARTAVARGATVQIFGYGYTVAGAADPMNLGGIHRGSAMVATVESNVFSTTGSQWTCTGDSGGPALNAQGEVIGVTSIGPTGCRVSTSYYTRVDRYLGLIEGMSTSPDAGAVVDVAVPPLDVSTSDVVTPSTGTAEGGCDAVPVRRHEPWWCAVALVGWVFSCRRRSRVP
jgi:V8-like Glu-specific endopeptidase